MLELRGLIARLDELDGSGLIAQQLDALRTRARGLQAELLRAHDSGRLSERLDVEQRIARMAEQVDALELAVKLDALRQPYAARDGPGLQRYPEPAYFNGRAAAPAARPRGYETPVLTRPAAPPELVGGRGEPPEFGSATRARNTVRAMTAARAARTAAIDRAADSTPHSMARAGGPCAPTSTASASRLVPSGGGPSRSPYLPAMRLAGTDHLLSEPPPKSLRLSFAASPLPAGPAYARYEQSSPRAAAAARPDPTEFVGSPPSAARVRASPAVTAAHVASPQLAARPPLHAARPSPVSASHVTPSHAAATPAVRPQPTLAAGPPVQQAFASPRLVIVADASAPQLRESSRPPPSRAYAASERATPPGAAAAARAAPSPAGHDGVDDGDSSDADSASTPLALDIEHSDAAAADGGENGLSTRASSAHGGGGGSGRAGKRKGARAKGGAQGTSLVLLGGVGLLLLLLVAVCVAFALVLGRQHGREQPPPTNAGAGASAITGASQGAGASARASAATPAVIFTAVAAEQTQTRSTIDLALAPARDFPSRPVSIAYVGQGQEAQGGRRAPTPAAVDETLEAAGGWDGGRSETHRTRRQWRDST